MLLFRYLCCWIGIEAGAGINGPLAGQQKRIPPKTFIFAADAVFRQGWHDVVLLGEVNEIEKT
jgi:hypothetical protein